MAEILTSDGSEPAQTVEAREAEIADSLRLGEEMMEAQEQRLAGKYNTTEELEAAYLELQKKLGSNDSNVSEESEETDDSAWMAEAQQALREGGLTEEVAEELQGMNGLEVYEALKNQVSPEGRDITDGELNSIYGAVGGEDAYNNLIGWAADNFSEAEISAYDQIIESGNMAQINLALQSLYYRYTDSMGSEGDLIQGKPAQSQSGFRSQQELIQAMNDPRYDNDPAYRQDVIDKLDRSNLQF